jgi:hypothetical protein
VAIGRPRRGRSPHDDGGCPHRFVGSCVGQSNGAFSSVVRVAADLAVVRAACEILVLWRTSQKCARKIVFVAHLPWCATKIAYF